MNEITQGLEVSVLGIVITFVALGVFILIMVVLQRLFPYKHEEEEESSLFVPEAPEVVLEAAVSPADEAGEVAAAIGAALAYWKARSRSSLGDALHEGRSGWWSTHRVDAQQGKPSTH